MTRRETLRRLRSGTGQLATQALGRLEQDFGWFRDLPAQERSWISSVAQAGISAFVTWYSHEEQIPHRGSMEVFASAPPDLMRAISLQQALAIIRTVVTVVEENSDEYASPGTERDLREGILRYSREIGFSAAEVYARAAESRGAWDARVEALVIDSLLRGEVDDELPSRAASLGWKPGPTLVLAGYTNGPLGEVQSAELRRSIRRAVAGAMVGIHDESLVIVTRTDEDHAAVTARLLDLFGEGPVADGGAAVTLAEVARATRAAMSAVAAAPAWASAPRPVHADDLLPERVLIGDLVARDRLIDSAYESVRRAGDSLHLTVATFLDQGASLEATASALFVHPNTVRYRLRKVAEVTGWDVTQMRDAHVLTTAFALGRLRDAGRPPL